MGIIISFQESILTKIFICYVIGCYKKSTLQEKPLRQSIYYLQNDSDDSQQTLWEIPLNSRNKIKTTYEKKRR